MNQQMQTISGIPLYSLDYLINAELSDNDINNLLENGNKSFKCSLIIGMLRYIGVKTSNYELIKQITTDHKWMYLYHCSKNQWDALEKMIMKIYKNIYSYSDKIAEDYAKWFMIVYGINVKGNSIEL